ncbi:hypothetical protein C8J57DRAFT_172047 [Mycena rebaudengoi]|nr:hypothetical protein C8J57DRAFT_172047 [Mycena rebaudengoi]
MLPHSPNVHAQEAVDEDTRVMISLGMVASLDYEKSWMEPFRGQVRHFILRCVFFVAFFFLPFGWQRLYSSFLFSLFLFPVFIFSFVGCGHPAVWILFLDGRVFYSICLHLDFYLLFIYFDYGAVWMRSCKAAGRGCSWTWTCSVEHLGLVWRYG